MTGHLKAIETAYKGYRFRSRLEARWAVFFDALGLRWEYEPEGYELPSGRYLPDFFVHWSGKKSERLRQYGRCGYWVEIKGDPPTSEEVDRLQKVCTGTRHHGYLLWGDVSDARVEPFCMDKREETEAEKRAIAKFLSTLGRNELPEYTLWASSIVHYCPARRPTRDSFAQAINAAKAARFEFGESGAPA